MQRTRQTWLAGVFGLGLLGAALVSRSWVRLAVRTKGSALPAAWAMDRIGPPAPRNRFEWVLRAARRWQIQAWRAVNEERYALEAWDPGAADSLDPAVWGRELLANDQSGRLRHARLLAAQAAALAGTPEEQYQAALLLAMLSCEAGDHRTELRETQVLARLAPASWVTRLWLRHAADHRGKFAVRQPPSEPPYSQKRQRGWTRSCERTEWSCHARSSPADRESSERRSAGVTAIGAHGGRPGGG